MKNTLAADVKPQKCIELSSKNIPARHMPKKEGNIAATLNRTLGVRITKMDNIEIKTQPKI